MLKKHAENLNNENENISDLEKNLKSVGDAETASLLSEKENKEEEKASTQALIVELIANIEGEISHQAKLTAALRDEAAAQALQVRRDQLEQELKTMAPAKSNTGPVGTSCAFPREE